MFGGVPPCGILICAIGGAHLNCPRAVRKQAITQQRFNVHGFCVLVQRFGERFGVACPAIAKNVCTQTRHLMDARGGEHVGGAIVVVGGRGVIVQKGFHLKHQTDACIIIRNGRGWSWWGDDVNLFLNGLHHRGIKRRCDDVVRSLRFTP